MVLTNFECWAHGGGNAGADFDLIGTAGAGRHVDLFNPRVVEQALGPLPGAAVSHISSNGYYGFSYLNAAHANENNAHNTLTSNDNNNSINYGNSAHNNNNNNNNNNNLNLIHNGNATAATNAVANAIRCKKRCFVADDDFPSLEHGIVGHDVRGATAIAKRCRFDDDYAAQYCNDFFSSPATQIGTQSCLMDTEDVQQHNHQQQQQQTQQVDVAMNFTQQPSAQQQQEQAYAQNSHHLHQTLLPHSHTQSHQVQQQQQQPQQQQHQHQHYQDDSKFNFCTISASNIDDSVLDYTNDNVMRRNELAIRQNDEKQQQLDDYNIDDATMFAIIHGGSAYHVIATQRRYDD